MKRKSKKADHDVADEDQRDHALFMQHKPQA